ncbi:Osmosensing histidine protein kinase SLN1 [Seminavis robusta]|uniref:histidine kinase n=1 Tax=Seminavis robusta TaxID=568900 RepID=A0A9N8EX82_9STRA|nr:Osmosensing histidine protein kinase SLN1 [Seminavis robusta]|eukprot:Sro2226_g319830.1 Osmosensing histidine protein kinase SLN1 (753) ;mRNA; f:12117-14538
MELVNACDLAITVAYFSIPLQILVSLWKSPPGRKVPFKLVVTLVLFAFFIFLCGAGHLMRYSGYGHTDAFVYVNVATALVSIVTALYLVPLIPSMFSLLDESLNRLTNESRESKSKLFTFMAFLCHEIRNPLFAITSSAEFLKDTELHAEQAEEVSSICDSSLLMLRLVNDVLDLSKLDSGKLELESREFDLHSLLRRLGENMTRQVDRKHKGGVRLHFAMDADKIPQIIIGDSCRILQIVYNLLSNSAKFTSSGKIDMMVRMANDSEELAEQEAARKAGAHTVTVSSDRPVSVLATTDDKNYPPEKKDEEAGLFSMALLDGDANADLEAGERRPSLEAANPDEDIMVLSITVADTGVGIPAGRLETIFEPYTQAKLSDFRQHGGTGLGLSIISSLIKAMGGTISVTSKAGAGTSFQMKIPVRVPRRPTLSTEHPEGSNSTETTSFDNQSGRFLECRRLPNFGEDPTSNDPRSGGTGSALTSGSLPYPPSVQTHPTRSRASSPSANEASLGSSPVGPVDLLSGQDTPTTDKLFEMDFTSRSVLDDPTFDEPLVKPMTTRTRTSSPLPPFNFIPGSNVVLVVDDNSVNRKILGKMLNTYKIEHRMAGNGQDAVDALLASRNYGPNILDPSLPLYGLVFMDVQMPVMDGNVAIRTIRKANIQVPIVALSANVLSQERDRTLSLGADASHTKPILRRDLHMLCTRFLYQNAPNQQYPPASPSNQHVAVPVGDSSTSSESSSGSEGSPQFIDSSIL